MPSTSGGAHRESHSPRRRAPRSRSRGFRLDPTIPLVVLLVAAAAIVIVLGNRADPEPAAKITSATPTTSEPPAPQVVIKAGPPLVREPVCRQLPNDTDLTVVSYNIKSGLGGLAGFADVIAASGADIVLLQEVDYLRHMSGRVDQPAYLGDALGMYHTFGANVFYGGSSQYGTAILSKYPIVSSENTHLPNRPGMQQRGLLHAVIEVEGKKMSVYSTHLQNLSEPMRMEQIRAIVGLVADDPLPSVIGGDFNAHPGSPVMGIARTAFDDTWTAVGSGSGYTHPSVRLRGRIDYLMHSNGLEPLDADVIPATRSDHRPVRALYTLPGPGGRVCVPYTGP